MKPKYEINKELVVSTSHITHAESQVLSLRSTVPSEPHDYGRRVLVGDEPEKDTHPFLKQCPNVRTLVNTAHDLGCKWLVLDCVRLG